MKKTLTANNPTHRLFCDPGIRGKKMYNRTID